MIGRLAAAALAGLVLGGSPALADDTRIRSVRVSADDVARTAKFYQDTFGLRQIRTIDREGKLFEIIMNYGDTPEAATASKSPKLVIILRKAGEPAPGVSNLIFGVKAIEATVARATAAGGKLSRPVSKSASGVTVGFVKDPAGNEVELIDE
jgi:predicted enzyme related to lactoylglutathione lyase